MWTFTHITSYPQSTLKVCLHVSSCILCEELLQSHSILLFYFNYTPSRRAVESSSGLQEGSFPEETSGTSKPQDFLLRSPDKIHSSASWQMVFSQMEDLLQCFIAHTGLLLQRAATVPAELSPRNSQLMRPEILLSNSWYFRLLSPSSVLFKGSCVCNSTSGTKENVVFMLQCC